MRKEFISSLILTVVCIVVLAGVYPLVVWGIAQLVPGKGEGFTVAGRGGKYYENIGQRFTDDKYFYSRPSAVNYNAAGSGGSNKGPSNPEYLAQVQARIDTFMVHNPGVSKSAIPSDLVTASGSGLDPDISIEGASIQIPRIAKLRGIPESTLRTLLNQCIEKPLWGIFGPQKVNVLKINIALDNLK